MNKDIVILKSPKFKIYYMEQKYINYLRQFDTKIQYNKNSTRPYVGVVYNYKNVNYFVPMAHPKPKHLQMNPKKIDIYKINNGKYGILNINNMIPSPSSCLTEVLRITTDKKYRSLLQNQLTFLNTPKNSKELIKKINNFQQKYRKGYLDKNVLTRTCNFPLLEKKCKLWNIIQDNIHTINDYYSDNFKNSILKDVEEIIYNSETKFELKEYARTISENNAEYKKELDELDYDKPLEDLEDVVDDIINRPPPSLNNDEEEDER